MKQQRSREKKELMANAAAQLLIDQGPSAVTHRNAAEVAGLAPGSGNYYFPSKAELYEAAVARAEDYRAAMASQLASSVSPCSTALDVSRVVLDVLFAPALTPDVVSKRLIPMLEAHKDPRLQAVMSEHSPLLRNAAMVAFERASGHTLDEATADLITMTMTSALLFGSAMGRRDPIEYAAAQGALLISKLNLAPFI